MQAGRQEYELHTSLGYTVSSRPAWVTKDLVSAKPNLVLSNHPSARTIKLKIFICINLRLIQTSSPDLPLFKNIFFKSFGMLKVQKEKTLIRIYNRKVNFEKGQHLSHFTFVNLKC